MHHSGVHTPVLLDTMLRYMQPRPNAIYLDGTFGGGGYTQAILQSSPCTVHGVDRDPEAVIRSHAIAETYKERFFFHRCDFQHLIQTFQADFFDGIVFDFGVSSFQLDTPDRGFSFQHDGPLDMRMDPDTQTLSAHEVINGFSESDLLTIISTYGEEPRSRRVARAIVQNRPFHSTHTFAACVRKHAAFKPGGIDGATRTFQAIRMYINDELRQIHDALTASLSLIKHQGILITVTFHSLEDRVCKQFFKKEHAGLVCQPLTAKPEIPSRSECLDNPRSRSAKLRAVLVLKENIC